MQRVRERRRGDGSNQVCLGDGVKKEAVADLVGLKKARRCCASLAAVGSAIAVLIGI